MPLSTKTFAILGLMAMVAVAVLVAKQTTAKLSPAVPTVVPSVAVNTTTPSTATANAARPKRQLLFFMNPNGIPCQTQWGLLNNVADSLLKVADVIYIKTTEPADLPKFEAFGIRGLPSLVIADESGRELSRFSPGIQPADAVLAALTK